MNQKRVVITGLGALTPIGNSIPQFWDALTKGVSGANLITHFDTTLFKTKFACEVKNFNPLDYIDRKEARKMDLAAQYAFVAAQEAVADAGILDDSTLDKERIGVILGTGIGGFSSINEGIYTYYAQNKNPKLSPFFIPRVLGDSITSNIAMFYGFKGASYVTTSACSSSANAIINAYHSIILGKNDIVITGGAEACIYDTPIAGFNSMNALSTNNDEYGTASRPLDITRDGFVMGEGAGIFIVEEYERAIQRGATIYAEITGTGLVTDTFHYTAPHPEGKSAYRAMKLALEEGGILPTQVQHINPHLTSTPLGDISECKAIANLFGDHAHNIQISATKSMTGHLLGGAAAIESIAVILAIKHCLAPPTLHLQNLDPEIPNLNYTLNKAVPCNIAHALNNSFGFGGHNTSILFSKLG